MERTSLQDPEKYRQQQQALHDLITKHASLKEYMVSLDQRRQNNRVASTAIAKGDKKIAPGGKREKIWMASGDLFLRLDRDEAKDAISKDSTSIEEEMEQVRQELTETNVALEQMQGTSQKEQVGAKLKAVSSKEMGQVLGSLRQEDE